jgi:hypothetical protein
MKSNSRSDEMKCDIARPDPEASGRDTAGITDKYLSDRRVNIATPILISDAASIGVIDDHTRSFSRMIAANDLEGRVAA